MEKRLFMYDVVSFACFLLSSLMAKSLKLFISFHSNKDDLDIRRADKYNEIKPSRGFMILLWVLASTVGVFGVVFLTLSLVDVVSDKDRKDVVWDSGDSSCCNITSYYCGFCSLHLFTFCCDNYFPLYFQVFAHWTSLNVFVMVRPIKLE
ncbi:hypothetical protein P3X46_011964 [Hevea brasiliensis]|uniref:Uncharacterized protein n=1 Tax=Hevea brasiliensis TaxID=3981 RepID=A0ABQ9MCN6_HEVBR|nr:hypothetical protein P3X46_011964 [Hevea brasiliensis]